ncbi:MAG: CGNR zinc finger domain-containing protein [Microthrixaceae bacterium]
MHVGTASQSEIRVTLETTFELANDLRNDTLDARRTLTKAGFTRSNQASAASLTRLTARLEALLPLLEELHRLDPTTASALVNEELTELPISPSIVEHDGGPAHIHWTPETGKFDDQVITDILMALAKELCDHGTERFGRCEASDCEALFYDGTRNRSRRFCADPRCASRTHTAEHRARKAAAT